MRRFDISLAQFEKPTDESAWRSQNPEKRRHLTTRRLGMQEKIAHGFQILRELRAIRRAGAGHIREENPAKLAKEGRVLCQTNLDPTDLGPRPAHRS
jgi:hypothetical protein